MHKDILILDTGILLLFIIGIIDKSLIKRLKHLKWYSENLFNELFDVISLYKEIVIPIQVWTEFSHFTFDSDIWEENKKALILFLKNKKILEIQITMDEILEKEEIYYLWFSDISCLNTAIKYKKEGYSVLLITSDWELKEHSYSYGIDCEKFIPVFWFSNSII